MSVHNYVCIYACMTVLIMTGCKPINYVSYTQQASHPRIWAVGRNKSRSGVGVGLVTVQEQMSHLRTNTARPPHLQSTSKKVCVV